MLYTECVLNYTKKGGITMARQVNINTTIGELLSVAPDAVPILMEIGMHCIG